MNFSILWHRLHNGSVHKDGHTVGWCCLFWSSVLEKSIKFSFHTFIKSWRLDIRHLFSAKTHSHKVKSKFSRWMNFPQHKLCLEEVRPPHLGEISPFCWPVTFNTSLTVTSMSGTCWQLKGMGKCWSQPKGGGVNNEMKEICQRRKSAKQINYV